MIVGILEVQLRLEGARCLKDKRRVVRSLLDHLRNDLRVSASETGDQSLWGNATIGVAAACANHAVAESVMGKAMEIIESAVEVEPIGVFRDFVSV